MLVPGHAPSPLKDPLPHRLTGAAALMPLQVIKTSGSHGSITFSAGAGYTYTASSTTSRSVSFLISVEDTS